MSASAAVSVMKRSATTVKRDSLDSAVRKSAWRGPEAATFMFQLKKTFVRARSARTSTKSMWLTDERGAPRNWGAAT